VLHLLRRRSGGASVRGREPARARGRPLLAAWRRWSPSSIPVLGLQWARAGSPSCARSRSRRSLSGLRETEAICTKQVHCPREARV